MAAPGGPEGGAAAQQLCSGRGMRRGAPAWAGETAAVEKLLGLTEEQLHAERLNGTSLAEIAASKNVSKDKLIETILSAKKAILDEQVKAGKISRLRRCGIQQHADAGRGAGRQRERRTGLGPDNGSTAGTRMGMGGRWNR